MPDVVEEKDLCMPCRQPELHVPPACPLQCCCRSCVAFPSKPLKINTEKTPIVWMLGGPGAGKGTQCDKIYCKYGFTYLSAGDLLRDEIKSGSQRASALPESTDEDQLGPNDVLLDLLVKAMTKEAPEAKGFIIDGYPQEMSQSEAFEQKIAPVTKIIYLEADEQTLMERMLSRGTTLTDEETIKKKLQTCNEKNEEILKQFSDKVLRVDAKRHIDDVFADVAAAIDPLVANNTMLK